MIAFTGSIFVPNGRFTMDFSFVAVLAPSSPKPRFLQPRDGVHTRPAGLDRHAAVHSGIAFKAVVLLEYILLLFACILSPFPHTVMAVPANTHMSAMATDTVSNGTEGGLPGPMVRQIQSGLPGFVLEYGHFAAEPLILNADLT